jgi:hypothetical protein
MAKNGPQTGFLGSAAEETVDPVHSILSVDAG